MEPPTPTMNSPLLMQVRFPVCFPPYCLQEYETSCYVLVYQRSTYIRKYGRFCVRYRCHTYSSRIRFASVFKNKSQYFRDHGEGELGVFAFVIARYLFARVHRVSTRGRILEWDLIIPRMTEIFLINKI